MFQPIPDTARNTPDAPLPSAPAEPPPHRHTPEWIRDRERACAWAASRENWLPPPLPPLPPLPPPTRRPRPDRPATAPVPQIEDRLTDFAVSILNIVESLPETLSGQHLAAQLIRSGTAAAPACAEARIADSPGERARHLKAVLRQLSETRVWLRVLRKRAYLPGELVMVVLRECEELRRLVDLPVAPGQRNT